MPIQTYGGGDTSIKGATAGLTLRYGTASFASASSGTVTFPAPYSSVPDVVAGQSSNGGFIVVNGVTTTGFTWNASGNITSVSYSVLGKLA